MKRIILIIMGLLVVAGIGAGLNYYGHLPEEVTVEIDGQRVILKLGEIQELRVKDIIEPRVVEKNDRYSYSITSEVKDSVELHRILVKNRLGKECLFRVNSVQIPKQALLIIDIQRTYSTIPFIGRLLDNSNHLIDLARKEDVLIVFIRHEGAKQRGGEFGFGVHSDLHKEEHDIIVDKKRANSFFETNLKDVLQEHGIEKLFLTGLSSDQCFSATGIGAIKEGYEVVVVGDAHSNFSSKPIEVIDMINSMFEKMDKATVLLSEEVTFN